MNIAIIGANGQFALDFKFACYKFGHEYGEFGRHFDWKELRDYDVVLNTAAYHKPLESCEEHPDEAIKNNVLLPQMLAKYCAYAGKTLVHLSTDHVYGECHRPSHEYDPKLPMSMYALTKSWAEQAINHEFRMKNFKKYFIFRISTVHGRKGTNFLEGIYKRTKNGEVCYINDDQLCNFTNAYHASEAILSVLEKTQDSNIISNNFFNCANKGIASFRYIASEAMRQRGIDVDNLILPKCWEDKIRPMNSVMCVDRVCQYYDMPDINVGITEYNKMTKGITW